MYLLPEESDEFENWPEKAHTKCFINNFEFLRLANFNTFDFFSLQIDSKYAKWWKSSQQNFRQMTTMAILDFFGWGLNSYVKTFAISVSHGCIFCVLQTFEKLFALSFTIEHVLSHFEQKQFYVNTKFPTKKILFLLSFFDLLILTHSTFLCVHIDSKYAQLWKSAQQNFRQMTTMAILDFFGWGLNSYVKTFAI